jgi:hypothetical protein
VSQEEGGKQLQQALYLCLIFQDVGFSYFNEKAMSSNVNVWPYLSISKLTPKAERDLFVTIAYIFKREMSHSQLGFCKVSALKCGSEKQALLKFI